MNPINEDTLRWQLQALRQDLPPPVDLWPGIETQITAAAAAASPRRAPTRTLLPWAMAASVLLAVVFYAQLAPNANSNSQPVAGNPVIRQQAVSMTLAYEKALAQLEQSGTRAELRPALDDLDRSARQILTAIEQDPEARFLLEQLRRTYDSRLQLMQRGALT